MAGVEGRVALVTGGGRGIGRATAELLASRGARVMCVARTRQELADVGLEYSVVDLGSPEGCARAVAEAEHRLGPIEILVCNHGIGSAHERVVWDQEPDQWRATLRINLDAPFHLSRLVLQGMVERRFGRVVFTSSTSGLVAEPAASAYNSSKHGLLGLMRSVAGGRWSLWNHIECRLARLGSDRDGRAFGPPRGARSGRLDRSGLERTGGVVSGESRRHAPGSSGGDRLPGIRGIERR